MENKLAIKLHSAIKTKTAKIGVVGVGYVGSALGLGAANGGFSVTGFARTQKSIDRVADLGHQKFSATNDFSRLSHCKIVCVCVPTPLGKRASTDFSMFKSALSKVAMYLKKGQLIIIESSIVPGTTRTVALPILLKSGLKLDTDFFLGFSPERIDPGNKTFTIHNTPKIVSGMTSTSLELIKAFYQTFVAEVTVVTRPETAEMAKFFENTFRFVNIGLANEFARYAKRLDVNVWEMIGAAATKPFGFLPHYPGPGIGGDCIPVLPRHLRNAAKKLKLKLPIIEGAIETDNNVPHSVITSTLALLQGIRNKKAKPKILLVGITYKPNIADLRESPALLIWKLLQKKRAEVLYHDPYVSEYNGRKSIDLIPNVLKMLDAIIITTPHEHIPYERLIKAGIPILDTRNALAHYSEDHIVRF